MVWPFRATAARDAIRDGAFYGARRCIVVPRRARSLSLAGRLFSGPCCCCRVLAPSRTPGLASLFFFFFSLFLSAVAFALVLFCHLEKRARAPTLRASEGEEALGPVNRLRKQCARSEAAFRRSILVVCWGRFCLRTRAGVRGVRPCVRRWFFVFFFFMSGIAHGTGRQTAR